MGGKMININSDKCIGCNACVKECVGAFIKNDNGKAVYTAKKCMGCGHCIAVCPVNAVSMIDERYDLSQIEDTDENYGKIDSDLLLKALKSRRSIRQYTKKKIEKEKLEKIIEAGRYTATAVNYQSNQFIIVQDRMEEFKKIAWEAFHIYLSKMNEDEIKNFSILAKAVKYDGTNEENETLFWGAPCLIIVVSEKPSRPWDSGMATQAMELMANAQGLGALFSGFMVRVIKSSEKLQQWLGIENLDVMNCMLVGYPAVKFLRTVPRKHPQVTYK